MSYRSIILDEQQYGGLPVAAYALDECTAAAGGVIDLMTAARGSANDGSYVATPTLDQRPGPVSREPGGWPLLTGASSQCVNVGTLGTLGASAAISVELWVKTTMSGTAVALFGTRDNTGPKDICGLYINLDYSGGGLDGAIMWYQMDHSSNRLQGGTTSTTVVRDGKVHHVAAVVDVPGKTILIYLDGEPLSVTNSYSGTLSNRINFPYAMYLGACDISGSVSQPLTGNLGRVAFYDYLLSADRVKAHYLAGINGNQSRLLKVA